MDWKAVYRNYAEQTAEEKSELELEILMSKFESDIPRSFALKPTQPCTASHPILYIYVKIYYIIL